MKKEDIIWRNVISLISSANKEDVDTCSQSAEDIAVCRGKCDGWKQVGFAHFSLHIVRKLLTCYFYKQTVESYLEICFKLGQKSMPALFTVNY